MESFYNNAQLKAIESSNGTLLQALAGSGKTSVIVEHLVFILQRDLVNSNKTTEEIQKYLTGLVICTFTIKASNELKIRIQKKLQQIYVNDPTNFYWANIIENLHFINICTIHSLLIKILSSPILLDAPHSLEIQSEIKLKLKIQKFIKTWNKKQKIFSIEEKRYLADALTILDDAYIRSIWAKPQTLTSNFNDFENFLIKFGYYPSHSIFFSPLEKPTWYEYASRINSIYLNKDITIIEKLKVINQTFLDFPSIPTIPKILKEDNDIVHWHGCFKKLKSFLQEYQDSIPYWDNPLSFHQKFKDFFSFVEEQYFYDSKFSFSDLEYLTFCLLTSNQDKWIKQSPFHYFIVDEFQDTSLIQSKILELLSKNDPKSLYLVGDPQQAIYGFRGGELKVYYAIKEKISNHLELNTNYRSGSKLVEYYNQIFTTKSSSPSWASLGNIIIGKISLNEIAASNTSKHYLDEWESIGLFQLIEHLVQKMETPQTVTVLYPKLTASLRLIEKLHHSKYKFKTQLKIPFSQDSLYILLVILLEFIFTKDKKSTIFLLDNLLQISSTNLACDQLLDTFNDSFQTINLSYAFKQFYYSLGKVSNLETDIFQELLEIIEAFNSKPESIYTFLEEYGENKFSFYFSFNQENESLATIQVMSVHQSKGLEFDHVLIGGINSLNLMKLSEPKITPTSFSTSIYSPELTKKTFQSIDYIIGKFEQKEEEREENFRLFYVACTRAKHTLAFVSIYKIIGDNEESLFSKDSWINHLLKINDPKTFTIIPLSIPESCQIKKNPSSLFKNNIPRFIDKNYHSEIGLITDVSVTNLLTLFLCPRKFYFSQILKIPNLDTIFTVNTVEEKSIEEQSSMIRGIKIHRLIEEYIKDKKTHPDLMRYTSVLTMLDSYRKEYLINCELSLKFELFTHMVNAIIDVFFYNHQEGKYEIWDFKTGVRNDKVLEESYFYQILLYSYGLFQNSLIPKSKNITMKIIYLDKERIWQKDADFSEIEGILYKKWTDIKNFNSKNVSICDHCSFMKICL